MIYPQPCYILGIETSCDDTCASVVASGHHICSNVIASQEDCQSCFGGIVPEIVARNHLMKISQVTAFSMQRANVSWADISAIAVTNRPGLASSLLVGVSFAKALAIAKQIPLIGINHIEGHIFATFLENPTVSFPHLCLTVSGGHTLLVLVKHHPNQIEWSKENSYEVIGQTTDDAVGEAFDKVSRTLGLGFPGGPAIAKIAKTNCDIPILFPIGLRYSGDQNFSLSGIKTAVRYYWDSLSLEQKQSQLPAIAAGFQQTIVNILVEKTIKAAKKYNLSTIILSGGVSANLELRRQMQEQANRQNIDVFYPSIPLCTDNAAMIAGLAYYKLQKKELSPLNLEIQANHACKSNQIA